MPHSNVSGAFSNESLSSPVDASIVQEIQYLTLEQARSTLIDAREGQKYWRQIPPAQRAAKCLAMLDAYAANLDEHALAITIGMGKPVAQAKAEFEGGMSQRVRYLCSLAEQLDPERIQDSARPEIALELHREPLGVVLDIAAWNYPLLVATNVVIPALIAGNAVLIKHAPATACVAYQLHDALTKAGVPADVVPAFMVRHADLETLMAERAFDAIAFTGSVASGQRVYQLATRTRCLPIGLELGGKDPAIVFEDCDFDDAVANLVDGSFYNAGQSCCAVERIYVHRSIHSRFVDAFVEQTHAYVLGDPRDPTTTLGPLATEQAALHCDEQVREALARGARQVSDDRKFKVPKLSPCYRPPRVLVDVHHEMSLMRNESFAPVIGIQAFDDEMEAIALANESDYGLTASIWSRDETRARELLQELEAGTVYLNRCDAVEPALAWTGQKHSGLGFTLSRHAMDPFTRLKSYNLRSRR